eukprot:3644041-Rhodomonas_salina.3
MGLVFSWLFCLVWLYVCGSSRVALRMRRFACDSSNVALQGGGGQDQRRRVRGSVPAIVLRSC